MFLDLGIEFAPPRITLHCTDSPFFVQFAGAILETQRGVGAGAKREEIHPAPCTPLLKRTDKIILKY
jgi:hypothetical protein